MTLANVKCCPYCGDKKLTSDVVTIHDDIRLHLAGNRWIPHPDSLKSMGATLVHCDGCTSEFWSDANGVDANASFLKRAFA